MPNYVCVGGGGLERWSKCEGWGGGGGGSPIAVAVMIQEANVLALSSCVLPNLHARNGPCTRPSNSIQSQDGQATNAYFVSGCVGACQSKHQSKEQRHQAQDEHAREKPGPNQGHDFESPLYPQETGPKPGPVLGVHDFKKVLGVLGAPEVMPLWQQFEAAFGGDANWDVNVPVFPTMSSTRYIKEGAPGGVVRVGR